MAEQKLAGLIGRPLDRVDGRLKVTGRATYAYEYAAQGAVTYGVIVPASIGKGRVVAVDVHDAERASGVLLVLTKDNAPPQTSMGSGGPAGPFCARRACARFRRGAAISAFPSRSSSPKRSNRLLPPRHWFACATRRCRRLRPARGRAARREPGPDQRRRGRRQCHR